MIDIGDRVTVPITIHGPQTCPWPCVDCDPGHHWLPNSLPPDEDDEDYPVLAFDRENGTEHALAFWQCKHCNAWISDEDMSGEIRASLGTCASPDCDGRRHTCYECGGEGYAGHDCGEDSCCCLDPEEDTCPICHGEGGWVCPYWNVQA